ncbi:MAG: AEC family transporter [Syntrophobacterales bacterium]|nr:AEC family transporter [Syntrophobacterales bacterium]
MLQVFVDTILPLFLVIMAGYALTTKGILNESWAGPANRVTYYIAVPAILFKSVAEQNIKAFLSFELFIAVIMPLFITAILGWLLVLIFFKGLANNSRGTFIHSSIHGNVGYMAYAVSYYALGEKLFSNVVILSSILIIVQNILGVVILTLHRRSWSYRDSLRMIFIMVVTNPIIISVFLGIMVGISGIKLPVFFSRLIKIFADMGLPTGLLLVGAGLTFDNIRHMWKEITVIGILKLAIMPALGVAIAGMVGLQNRFLLPLLILLASPSATITYVMATQLGGSPSLASAVISVQTIVCAISYSVVIGLYR